MQTVDKLSVGAFDGRLETVTKSNYPGNRFWTIRFTKHEETFQSKLRTQRRCRIADM
jgi:hypothetical protein